MKSVDLTLTKQHLSTRIYKAYFGYLSKHYPEIDISKICEQSGLPFDYVNAADNWVSILFDFRFMSAMREKINDPEFEYKVGCFSVSREGLGPILYSIGRNGFSLHYLMNNLWKYGQYFNRVMSFELEFKELGQINLKLKPLFAEQHLNTEEAEALKKSLPHICQNTKGYFSSAPLLKNLPPADVTIEIKEDYTIDLQVKYVVIPARFKEYFFWSIAASSFQAFLFHNDFSLPIKILGLTGFALAYCIFRFVKRTTELNDIVNQTENSLKKIDEQYRFLLDTKTKLQRKLQETEAINAITNNLIGTSSEEEILSAACKELNQKLNFDRSLILLQDSTGKYLEYRAGYFEATEIESFINGIKFEIDLPSQDPTKISNVFRFQNPILIEDVETHIGTLNSESQKLLELSGSKSFICVPIASKSNAFGVLLVDNLSASRRLTDQDLSLLSTVGRQIAVVLEKQRAQSQAVEAFFELDSLAQSYSRFVPWKMIHLLGYKSVLDVNLQTGSELNMAIVFTDIRGFTSMAEEMSPTESLAFLNSYFSNLAPIFEKHHGVIDKFLGDGIMALFVEPDDAIRAVSEYQNTLDEYNLKHRSGNKRPYIKAGMGLHFGKVLLGAVGFKERLSISVVSDSVNLASRLDGLTKRLGVEALCTEDVIANSKINADYRLVAELRVVGRQSLTKIYELYGHGSRHKKELYEESKSELCELVKLWSNRDFHECDEIIGRLISRFPDDPVLRYYYQEIAALDLIKKGRLAS
jgi:class 3 adenylate cyclase